MKIVVLDGYGANPGDLSWEPMKALGELTVYDRTELKDLQTRAKDADALLTNKVPLRRETIESLPKLKYIGVLATGFNIIDTEAARERSIPVCNIPAYSTDSVAQMVFAHLFAITNRVEHYAALNRKGFWSNNPDFCYWDTPLHEIAGKTMGVVGLGNIGRKVAEIARTFGMDVFAFTSKSSSDLPAGIQKTTMEGLFGISDVISLHCPLTDTTRGFINKDSIKRMKHGAILINTGRGPLVNEADVAEALKTGELGAYGTDVMSKEPPAADNPLLTAPNAYITPHIAWATYEARVRLMDIAVANVRAFTEGQPQNVVNP